MASSTRIGLETAVGGPQTAPRGAWAEELADAVGRGVKHLLSLQTSEGYWVGELEADTTLESDYIFYLHILDKADPQRVSKLANYIRRRQLPDGGWNIYFGGPSELNATVKAYFALKLAGDLPGPAAHGTRSRARAGTGRTGSDQLLHPVLSRFGGSRSLGDGTGSPAGTDAASLLVCDQHLRDVLLDARNRNPAGDSLCAQAEWPLPEAVRVDELFRDAARKVFRF